MFRFVVVARLIKSKGVDISIRAFAQLLEEHPVAELVIVGDGPQRDELEKLGASLSLSDKLCFRGMVGEDEVARILRSSDALLHHSVERYGWVEGFGVAVSEAAASGLPVVVSRSGGLVDQVEDGKTGFIVPIGDVGAMAAAMKTLCGNRELSAQLGKAGRRRMVDKYDSRKLAERLRGLLADAAQISNSDAQPKSMLF